MRDLVELYRAERDGRPADLPPLSVPYREFADRQRARLTADAVAGHADYWRGKPAGFEPLPLPTDRPVECDAGFAGDVVNFELSAPASAALRTFAPAQPHWPLVKHPGTFL